MTGAELLAASDANYYESWRMLSEASGLVHEEDGVLITASSPSLAWLNVVFVTRPLRDPEKQLGRAFALLDERKLPFFVHLREGIDDASERACERLGLVPENPVPGMAMAPIAGSEGSAEIETRPARDDATFADFLAVVAESFSVPTDEMGAALPPNALRRPDTHYWVGYVDGRPVACSCLIVIGKVAGINAIGTLEGYRGRGYGAALTWQAVEAGADAGCEVAVLQASDMGRPVYERMGFRTVTSYKTYMRPG